MSHHQNTIQLYNRVAQQYQDIFMNDKRYHHSYDKLLSHLSKNHRMVLDVACGPGVISHYLLQNNANLTVLGIDAAEKMIELATNNVPEATFKVLDCRAISTLHTLFDVLIFGFCFPYVTKEEVHQLIKDAYQLLTPNGLLYISTMMGNYDTDSGYKSSSDGKNTAFIYYHSQEDLQNMLLESDFQILENYTKLEQEGTHKNTDLFLIAKK
ncbi:class I SAM-dependent methyltransferase [Tenacibaculum sp. TC6]|uniref:class I SAM-dependent methyltransferase n=1 Tax=Tenacibaculum sp. TC6 TaxID=3423223 RepID=UPI003D36B658